MWLLWLRALYYLCFCCLFRPFSSSTHTHTRTYAVDKRQKTTISDPRGVVPENHSTGQSEWFFSVDFSNRFRLIGVLALSFFPRTLKHPHPHTHTHTASTISRVLFIFKASHTHTPTSTFSTLNCIGKEEEVRTSRRKRKTKLTQNELY